MPSGLARTSVRRVHERVKWIGEDHGDAFEEALITGATSNEMHVAPKEILDHLRCALDYAAREICAFCGPLPLVSGARAHNCIPMLASATGHVGVPVAWGRLSSV